MEEKGSCMFSWFLLVFLRFLSICLALGPKSSWGGPWCDHLIILATFFIIFLVRLLTRPYGPEVQFCRFYRDGQVQFCRFYDGEQVQLYSLTTHSF